MNSDIWNVFGLNASGFSDQIPSEIIAFPTG
jgi:hypothetical protein